MLGRIDVLDISNPAAPSLDFFFSTGGVPNSVAIRDGIVAVAVENPTRQLPGWVKFYSTAGALLNTVVVGAVPDMITFTPNGRRVLVANEGEPNSYGQPTSVDPVGSVSIIDMTPGVLSLTQADVSTAGFSPSIPVDNPSSFRVYGPGASLAQDMEPEYITVSHDSKTAWVTLQENNAIGVLDIEAAQFTRIVGLGFKDHSSAGNGLDPSDRDNPPLFTSGTINIGTWPVRGMYQPDSIDAYRVNGQTYLVMAHEGDSRDYTGFNEEVRVSSGSYVLDPVIFPDAATLKLNQNLGRLTVTNQTGTWTATRSSNRFRCLGPAPSPSAPPPEPWCGTAGTSSNRSPPFSRRQPSIPTARPPPSTAAATTRAPRRRASWWARPSGATTPSSAWSGPVASWSTTSPIRPARPSCSG
jgi:hypothetical protein